MGRYSFPAASSGSTDWSKYGRSIYSNNSISILQANTYQTVLSLTGQGYTKFIGIGASNGATIKVKITIDGVNIYENTVTTTTGYNGLFDSDILTYNGSVLSAAGLEAVSTPTHSLDALPAIALVNNCTIMLIQPLFFKQSLLIEIQASNISWYGKVQYLGGLIV